MNDKLPLIYKDVCKLQLETIKKLWGPVLKPKEVVIIQTNKGPLTRKDLFKPRYTIIINAAVSKQLVSGSYDMWTELNYSEQRREWRQWKACLRQCDNKLRKHFALKKNLFMNEDEGLTTVVGEQEVLIVFTPVFVSSKVLVASPDLFNYLTSNYPTITKGVK